MVQVYFRYAEYDDCVLYSKRILKIRDCTVQREEFYTEFGLALYYLSDYPEMIRFHNLTLGQAFMESSVDFCLVRDLKALHDNQKVNSAFRTILEYKFQDHQLLKNRALSFDDLGFLYSLVSLAYRPRHELLKEVSWSCGLEHLYLRRQYRALLHRIDAERESRCFNPILARIYAACQLQIRIRVFSDVVQSFDRCPYALLHQLTGITEGEGLMLIRKDTSDRLHVLVDTVTSSFVFKRDMPLQREVAKLHTKL